MTHGQIDFLPSSQTLLWRYVVQHPVAYIHPIVEADQAPRRAMHARKIFEHVLASDAPIWRKTHPKD